MTVVDLAVLAAVETVEAAAAAEGAVVVVAADVEETVVEEGVAVVVVMTEAQAVLPFLRHALVPVSSPSMALRLQCQASQRCPTAEAVGGGERRPSISGGGEWTCSLGGDILPGRIYSPGTPCSFVHHAIVRHAMRRGEGGSRGVSPRSGAGAVGQ